MTIQEQITYIENKIQFHKNNPANPSKLLKRDCLNYWELQLKEVQQSNN